MGIILWLVNAKTSEFLPRIIISSIIGIIIFVYDGEPSISLMFTLIGVLIILIVEQFTIKQTPES